VSSIADRLAEVERRIQGAVERAGRTAGSAKLIAVSKLQPSALIREAHQCGQRHFGENYAQELRDKGAELADLPGVVWHALGPLQLNKVKYVAKLASYFHALDRIEVATELSRRRTQPIRCFVEVNVAGEASKSGVDFSQAPGLVSEVRKLANLELVGLMCMPPLTGNPEDSRPHFRRVAELARSLGLEELSMGSTGDFEVAIEEGASWVRVGTALFGERH
jgi:pyridoxal phosphate enzyme (YggS family)